MNPPHRTVFADHPVSQLDPVLSVASERNARQRALTAIRAELAASPYAVIRRVRCELEGDTLTLSGRVSSFYLKQLAQQSAIDQPAIEKIVNLIEVAAP